MPPKPLKRATISGMEVMATSRAARAPMTDPATRPTTIQGQWIRLSEARAVTMASSMPTADTALPFRAEPGRLSIFSPKTKSMAATM